MSYIEEIRTRGRDANPFFRLMGINLGPLGKGVAELSMQVRPDMLNGVGWLQGGLFTALCDEAMALALFTILDEDEDEGIATISESTSFFQGIREGRIKAVGRVIKKGHSVAFMEGMVTNSDDGSRLSETVASFVIMSKRRKE
jgi:acyl-CoA thioesterase